MRARTFRTAASASANSYGHYATPPGVSTWFSGAVARCMKADDTFPRVTVHDLRHTPASLAISAGANVKVICAGLVRTYLFCGRSHRPDLKVLGEAADGAEEKHSHPHEKKGPPPARAA